MQCAVYYELSLKINPKMEDIISELCFENLPCEGVVLAEEAYKDLEMISTTEGTLKIFLTDNADIKDFLIEQRELLKSRGFSDEDLGSWDYTLEEKENQDWSKKWKEKWDVTHVSDKITIVPDWIEYSPKSSDEVVIRLEPGCAFGTGTHATTQLCMLMIEKYMPRGAKVADIGMGSGILAICASKFGASFVTGRTFFFHSKPILGMIKFGLDATWVDLNWNNYTSEYMGENGMETASNHQIEYSLHVGPSVAINPVGKLNINAYFRYAPTFSLRYSGGQDIALAGNYATMFVTGGMVSWGIIGIGAEYRFGTCRYKNFIGNSVSPADMSGFRAFISLRFK